MYEYGTGTLDGAWALLACLILPISFGGIGIRFLERMLLEIQRFITDVTDNRKDR
jgi:TRAP-type C4-dicarboxylate transport system permease small subunit